MIELIAKKNSFFPDRNEFFWIMSIFYELWTSWLQRCLKQCPNEQGHWISFIQWCLKVWFQWLIWTFSMIHGFVCLHFFLLFDFFVLGFIFVCYFLKTPFAFIKSITVWFERKWLGWSLIRTKQVRKKLKMYKYLLFFFFFFFFFF